jgi:hypothetical protein
MPGLGGPGQTKGYLGTKGLTITYKKRERKNLCLSLFGVTLFFVGIAIMIFRYYWENHPHTRDFYLSNKVRYAATAYESARSYIKKMRIGDPTGTPISVASKTEKDALGNDVAVIVGDSLQAMLMQQGYMHARDRIAQMDFLRMTAIGNLSANFGPTFLERDIFIRPFGLRQIALRDCSLLTGDERALADAYSAGVNQHIKDLERTAELPLEHRVSDWHSSSIDEWTCADSFMLFRLVALRWSHGWEASLADAALKEANFSFGHFSSENINNFNYNSDIIFKYVPSVGSSSWAISKKNGGTLLYSELFGSAKATAFDNAWYANSLQSPEFSVTGFSFPGIPFVLIGSNDNLSWAINLSPERSNWFKTERFQKASCSESSRRFACGSGDGHEDEMCSDLFFENSVNETDFNTATCSSQDLTCKESSTNPMAIKIKTELFSEYSYKKMQVDKDFFVHYAIDAEGGVFIPSIPSVYKGLGSLPRHRKSKKTEQKEIVDSESCSGIDAAVPVTFLKSESLTGRLGLQFLLQINQANGLGDFSAAVKSSATDALFLNWIYADKEGNIASLRSGRSARVLSSDKDTDIINPSSKAIISGDSVLLKNLQSRSSISSLDKVLSKMTSDVVTKEDFLELLQDDFSPLSLKLSEIISAIGESSDTSSKDSALKKECLQELKDYDGFARVGSRAQIIIESFKNELVLRLAEGFGSTFSKYAPILHGVDLLPLTDSAALFNGYFYNLGNSKINFNSSVSTSKRAALYQDVFVSTCRSVDVETSKSKASPLRQWGSAHAAIFTPSVQTSFFGRKIYTPGPIELGGTGDSMLRTGGGGYYASRGIALQSRMFVELRKDSVSQIKTPRHEEIILDTALGKNNFNLDSYENYLMVNSKKKLIE